MSPAPIKLAITMADLEKIDIRAGTILAVEDVPGSDKLVQLRVGFGDHERVILSGMKQERADPREIIGRQALFVVNLEPRKMRGIVSQACSSTSVSPTALSPHWPCPSIRSRMDRAPGRMSL